MTDLPARRLLLVHAHPDDETINNGATMAKYAAEGALVTLVTCTLGEEGEVIPPELAQLAADRDDTLGEHRIGELASAMAELGVTDHRFLGGAGRYRDSGMMGLVQNEEPDCFWQADLDEAAGHLAEVILDTRPQALVTYDSNGGYGHPDHIQAHRVALRGYELAADQGHRVARVYEICTPRSAVEAGFRRLAEAGKDFPFGGVATVDDVPGVVDDDQVTVAVDGAAYADRKTAAMRAHASQIAVDGPFFALSNDLGQPYFSTEYYRQVRGDALSSGAAGGAGRRDGSPSSAGWGDDLFDPPSGGAA
ncbi:N-acetyl-1-D-myo-inositol-2-amino-2-deoxy-alpha-D-glucopyranoside deacetylase [Streptomyces sp. DvalAA-14]|uniref:N-acetyl-1-D-myo-inositol-2-amino-2-deoxy-alpha- D-glucopyranoside deacetylase n=1 Tax=unclassified Streptomyces TaxID=2593676 RepID=UPI00081AEE1D|nr:MULTISPECIES: N-acetyl-1-D-myo-inositol-2-amino-2-deoxy-alpha-D-glucopyranoside deacetylase [unclassified Streptomyces]MYS21436.1 N-acetyl-1-D-myo-inositol-2-amino-2-deoxy-alpha-D-glucopyranoside deacetylase [Streptomyces sp. SID4948]SCD92688.1 N-acetyl-1-D-myo-inositol-2-amino-2-deoxy-alpha-D-glucopyranoside deacetylase [Streptomyces sp. DvalAA-14]